MSRQFENRGAWSIDRSIASAIIERSTQYELLFCGSINQIYLHCVSDASMSGDIPNITRIFAPRYLPEYSPCRFWIIYKDKYTVVSPWHLQVTQNEYIFFPLALSRCSFLSRCPFLLGSDALCALSDKMLNLCSDLSARGQFFPVLREMRKMLSRRLHSALSSWSESFWLQFCLFCSGFSSVLKAQPCLWLRLDLADSNQRFRADRKTSNSSSAFCSGFSSMLKAQPCLWLSLDLDYIVFNLNFTWLWLDLILILILTLYDLTLTWLDFDFDLTLAWPDLSCAFVVETLGRI
jgi:hypothetical protein